MKLALIGVGLVGGSFVAALRAAGAVREVVGYDVDGAALALAQSRGVVNAGASSAAAAVQGADLVVLATPVGAMRGVLDGIAADLGPEAVVTDVGSTKASVVADARAALGAAFARFVPAHPIAGGERPGVGHADASLFEERLVITTPEPETDPAALAAVEAVWRGIGARVERMRAAEHDRIFAAVSHLPHVLAFALVDVIARSPDAAAKFAHAGAGFRDVTRIAASSPSLWRDVCLANRRHLADELRAYRATLDRLQAAIEAGDGAALEATFRAAADAKRAGAPRTERS
jgi:prephenate dehydrogenase